MIVKVQFNNNLEITWIEDQQGNRYYPLPPQPIKMPAKPNTQNYLCTHCSEPMKQNWIQDSLTLTPTCNCEGTYIPLTDRDNQIQK